MRLLSNAKINLGLFVGRKRKDGFHQIESLFIPIPWYDEITIKEEGIFSFKKNGIPIDGSDENNLCVKAYQIMRSQFSISEVSIELNKKIPIGAGLGGGSSNAATVMKGLRTLFNIKVSDQELGTLADQLGSDCSFFISNEPTFVSGKGEVHKPANSFKINTYCIVVYPNIHIETKWAYKMVEARDQLPDIAKLIEQSKGPWEEYLTNDFEEVVKENHKELEHLKKDLLSMGAHFAAMSGSGSSFFAFFEEEPKAILFESKYDYRIFRLAF